jgi:hypothetical protein
VLEKSGKQIAQDIVEVEVYGPEMTDLTLIDLPGYVKVGDKVQTGSIVDEINVLIRFLTKTILTSRGVSAQ